jgi:alkylhydroperoxidase family enzyme
MPPYISPLEPPYSPGVAEELSILMSRREVEPLRLFRTLAQNLPMTRAWGTLGAHNLGAGALPVRDRELIILRTCYLNGCEYEWGVHARIFSGAAKLSEAQYLATARPLFAAAGWAEHDLDVLRFADALNAEARASAGLLSRLAEAWDNAQLLEACEVAGFYRGVSYMANVAGVELEPWAIRFPS